MPHDWTDEFKKGDKIKIENNSIFKQMGFSFVTGKIFLMYPDGHGFSFKCDQTGAMETFSFGHGDISKVNEFQPNPMIQDSKIELTRMVQSLTVARDKVKQDIFNDPKQSLDMLDYKQDKLEVMEEALCELRDMDRGEDNLVSLSEAIEIIVKAGLSLKW